MWVIFRCIVRLQREHTSTKRKRARLETEVRKLRESLTEKESEKQVRD